MGCAMIILNLLEQSLRRHVFNRMNALLQALDCIVSLLLIWGGAGCGGGGVSGGWDIKRYHMSRHKDKQHLQLQSGYCLKCRRYKGKKGSFNPC